MAFDRECYDRAGNYQLVNTSNSPRRRWGTAYQLSDLLEQSPGGLEFASQDFALLTLAAELSICFPGQLVFKGGFVLRHVHGILRFSTDVDATRHKPPRLKLDAGEVAKAISHASVGDIVRFSPQMPPATDSARSLDFDHVSVTGLLLPDGEVQVEISYREAVIDPPERAMVGLPFYERFEVLSMAVPEMAAEKMRALAQRTRATDLADLAEMLARDDVSDVDIARLAIAKFAFVKQGTANRSDRIERNLEEIGRDYDVVVPSLFPNARSYRDAVEIVWPRIRPLIP
jgi:predicted nucleotidyltransferase component of viral defense system